MSRDLEKIRATNEIKIKIKSQSKEKESIVQKAFIRKAPKYQTELMKNKNGPQCSFLRSGLQEKEQVWKLTVRKNPKRLSVLIRTSSNGLSEKMK